MPNYLYYSFYILTFFAIFFSIFTGFYAAFNFYALRKYTLITFWIFLIAGLILGPLNLLFEIHFDLKAILFSYDIHILKFLGAFILWWIGHAIFKRFKVRWAIVTVSVLTLILLLLPYWLFIK